MKRETRSALLSAVLEAGLVVLGVVLALLANEWRQDVANRKAGRIAVESVVAELR